MKEENNSVETNEVDEDEILIRPRKAPVPVAVYKKEDLLKTVAGALEELRAKRPVIQCLANPAATSLACDALLALGAQPVPIVELGEASALAPLASASLVNVAAQDRTLAETMRAAVARTNAAGRPWVLDPEAVGALPLRTYLAKELVRRFPAMIRGNASEIAVLAGQEPIAHPLDAFQESARVVGEAKRLAAITHAAVIVTGAVDYVTSPASPVAAIANGSVLMARVSGTGCAQAALGAAFLATLGRNRRFEAGVAASIVPSLAGEIAASKVKSPGSFSIAWLDALDALTPDVICKRTKLTFLDEKAS